MTPFRNSRPLVRIITANSCSKAKLTKSFASSFQVIPIRYKKTPTANFSTSAITRNMAEVPEQVVAQTEAQPAPATQPNPPREKKDNKKKSKKGKIELKVPKGTKDWAGKDMVIRDKIFSTITEAFRRHGAVTIDTPYELLLPIFLPERGFGELELTTYSPQGVRA